jgi:hypothetical protein
MLVWSVASRAITPTRKIFMTKAAPYFNWLKEAPSEEKEEKEEKEGEEKGEKEGGEKEEKERGEKEEARLEEKTSDSNSLPEKQNIEYDAKDLDGEIDAL